MIFPGGFRRWLGRVLLVALGYALNVAVSISEALRDWRNR